jgi:hypothetical protein
MKFLQISLLNINSKPQKIENLTLNYVEIHEILNAFHGKNYEINSQVKNSTNGDDF